MLRPALLVTLILAGCQESQGAGGNSAAPDDPCGKARYADLVGEPERNHSFEAQGGVRIIYPDMAVTQDYRPDRLNVDVNRDGDIARLWCG